MKNKLVIKGTVIDVLDTIMLSEKFIKRELIIETDEMYSQTVKIDFTQIRISLLDEIKIGQVVDVHFNVRGKKWQDKYYVNLEGWDIDIIKDVKPIPKPSVEPKNVNESQNEYGDDFPF